MKPQDLETKAPLEGSFRQLSCVHPLHQSRTYPMPVEIERKFLVVSDGWREQATGQRFCQGYLARADGVTVRVRRAGARAYLTVKGEPNGIVRPEFEYEVPVEEAEAMFRLCHRPLIEKTRYEVSHAVWLQAELIKLQDWVVHHREKVVVILFEGRDSAGKGGLIKRITQRLNPRVVRTVALPAPSDREKTQWYFQRYVPHLPAGGEIVLFDRSWYNRAGVERVMGFATEDEVEQFFRDVPEFERMLVRSGIRLVKYWFSISDQEQQLRFLMRIHDPLKQWKLSPMDLEPGALGGLHQGQGGDVRPHLHPRGALAHRGGQRQEAGPAQLHRPPPGPSAKQPVHPGQVRALLQRTGSAHPGRASGSRRRGCCAHLPCRFRWAGTHYPDLAQ
jgi:polyphosphate kinase 2